MARQLPPAFAGIDFSTWAQWPIVIRNGIPYRAIPGQSQYLYSPYSGQYGEIVADGDAIAEAAGYEEPKEPGMLEDLAPAAGLLGGLYLVNKGGGILDAGKEAIGLGDAAEVATGAGGGTGGGGAGGIFGGLFGGGEAAATPAAVPNNGIGLGLSTPTGGVVPEAAPFGSTAIPLAAAAYGGYQLFKMATGKKRNMAEKLSMALPTAGLSLLPFEHESTRDVARRHTRDLQGQAEDDSTWQNYVGGMRQQFESAPKNDKPFGNSRGDRYGSFSEYRAAGLDPDNLTGVYGNLETYGPEWAHLTYDQQRAITAANIADDNYYSKKGEVRLRDKEKAIARKNEVLAGALAPTPPKPQTMGQSVAGGILGDKPLNNWTPPTPTPVPNRGEETQLAKLPVGMAAQLEQQRQTPIRPVFQLNAANIKKK